MIIDPVGFKTMGLYDLAKIGNFLDENSWSNKQS